MTLRRMLLKPWLRAAQDANRVLIESDGILATFDGPGAKAVMPNVLALLDGSKSREEIVAHFEPYAQRAVEQLLGMLDDQGLIAEVPSHAIHNGRDHSPALEHLLAFSATGRMPSSPVVEARVAIVGQSSTAASVRALLSDTGLVSDVGGSGFFDSDFVVAAPAADEMPELSVWNRQALAARVAWLPLSPFDGHGWTIGPFAIPHETCCFECYRTRRALTVEYADDAKLVDIAASRSRNVTPVDAIVAGIAAMFAWRWLALSDPYLPGMLYSLGWSEGLSLGKHEVLRVPRCSACAEPGIAAGLAPWREPAAT